MDIKRRRNHICMHKSARHIVSLTVTHVHVPVGSCIVRLATLAAANTKVKRRRRKRETLREMRRKLYGRLMATERRNKGGPVNDIKRVEHIVVEPENGRYVCQRKREGRWMC